VAGVARGVDCESVSGGRRRGRLIRRR
jgi:hypothetical protein